MISEKKLLEPLRLNKDSVISQMRTLRNAPPFEVLCGLWQIQREEIIKEGKKTRREGLWEAIDGFDKAANVALVWAQKKMTNEFSEHETPLQED